MKKIKFIFIIVLLVVLGGCAKKGTTDIFRFENHQVTVEVGDTKPLSVTGNFEKGDDITYELIDSEDDIVFMNVDSNDGLSVLAIKPGEVTIRASIVERNVAATVIVEVIMPKTSAIKIIAPEDIVAPTDENPRYQIKLNTPVDFDFILSPETEINNKVIWSVEDINHKKIVSDKIIIRDDGVFTAFVGGDMFVVATSLDGKTTAKLAIHVEYTPITSLTVEIEENNSKAAEVNIRNAYLRESIKLKVNVSPSTSNPEVVWSSNTTNVTVDAKTGLVYCNSVGSGNVSAIITATSVADVSVKGSITLNFTYAPAESINLITADLVAVTAGQSTTLNAEVSPANANPSLVWNIISQDIVPVFDVITNTEIKDLGSLTQAGNIATLKTIYHGEIVVRVVSSADNTVFTDVTVKITARPIPTNISIVSAPSVLKQTVNFYDDSQIKTVTEYNTGNKYLAFGSEIVITAKVIPLQAYQDLEFIVGDPSVAIITNISQPSSTGETQIRLIPIKPGSTDLFITHKYSSSYPDLQSVVLTLNISEQSVTLDKTLGSEVIKIDEQDYEYYFRGNLTNFDYEFETAYNITDFSWRVIVGDGGVVDGAKVHTIYGDFVDTFLYVAETGIYHLEAVDNDNNQVFFTTKIVVITTKIVVN